jgi:hypothetical protein
VVKKVARPVAADRTPDRRQTTGPGKDFHSDATHTLGILSATDTVRDDARRAVTHVHLHRPETVAASAEVLYALGLVEPGRELTESEA